MISPLYEHLTQLQSRIVARRKDHKSTDELQHRLVNLRTLQLEQELDVALEVFTIGRDITALERFQPEELTPELSELELAYSKLGELIERVRPKLQAAE